jgi:succinate dehydrogenase/fumarate reductase flavoprotein subunit
MTTHLDIPVAHHDTDVLIIGGGAAGTMAAFQCAEAGVAVVQAPLLAAGWRGRSHRSDGCHRDEPNVEV